MDTLRLGIHAELEIGSLLGGEINWPLECELTICGDYYLVQADVVRGEQGGLDILQLLNTSFGCSLPEGVINVDKAGFFTFARRREIREDKTLEQIFPAHTLPDSIAGTVLPMDNTTAFWLVVNLRALDILDHLVEIGVPGQENQLALHALLNNGKSATDNFHEVILSAALPDMTLLHVISFKNTRFCLHIASDQRRAFQLAGTVRVNLFGQEYAFHGRIDSDSRFLHAEISSSHQLDKPFSGEMRGIVFDDLAFCLNHAYQDADLTENAGVPLQPGESLLWLSGRVRYASMMLSGKLYLHNGSPVLACVAIEQDFSLSQFFAQSLGISWPASLFDLQLGAGSQIYYRAAQTPLPSCFSVADYRNGFNILAYISLTLWKTLSFSLTLQVTDDAVIGSAALHAPVDLYIIQLTGKGGGQGPNFGLAKKGQDLAMYFAGGVCFFGEKCGDITVSCSRNTAGKLHVSGSIFVSADVFRNLIPKPVALEFAYNSDDGFSLKNWPDFDFAHSCIDFVEEIKQWANSARGGICSAIPGFINQHLLQTTFHLHPSFAPQRGSNNLCLCLSGRYTLSMFDEEILTLSLPSLISVALPDNVSWDALPNLIGQALADAGSSLIKGIVNNSENLSKVLLVLCGKEALETAATLVCRNLIDQVIVNALRAAVAALIEEYGGKIAAGALAGLFALIASHTKDHPEPKPKPDPTVAPDVPEYLLAGTRVNAEGLPEIVFTWSPAALADKYWAQLQDAGGNSLATNEVPNNGYQTIFPRSKSGDSTEKYVLSVQAEGNGKRSDFARCTLNRLSSPALSVQYQQTKGLQLSWSSPASRAEGFELKIASENSERRLPVSEPHAVFDPDLPEHTAMHYRFSVRALSSLPNLSSAFSKEVVRTRIPGSTLTNLSLQAEQLTVTWQAPAQASQNRLQLRSRHGGQSWLACVEAPAQSYVFALPMEEGSGLFFAQVSARVADGSEALPALWSAERRVFRSLYHLAQIARSRGLTALECGQFLRHDRPAAKLQAIVCCLAAAGYPLTDLTLALRQLFTAATLMDLAKGLFRAGYSREEADGGLTAAWPDVSRAEMHQVLDAVYGTGLSLEQAAAQFFAQGINGTDCGKQLIARYPHTESVDLAKAMAKAGYAAHETSAGLVGARADMPLNELAAALLAAYGPPQTAEALALDAFAQGLNGAECGKRLITAHPHTGSVDLAKAMANAGYDAKETLAGLTSACPDLTLKALVAAIRAAYG